MSNLVNALAIVLSITAMLILAGYVASDIKGTDMHIITCAGTLYNNCTGTYILNSSNPQSILPDPNINPVSPTGITGEEGIFTIIGAWLSDVTGITFVYNIITAPSTFLKAVGLTQTYADIIATIWYSLTLFLIISWWKGQDS
jgi:hypothetical protein